jgi:hypothetical protein
MACLSALTSEHFQPVMFTYQSMEDVSHCPWSRRENQGVIPLMATGNSKIISIYELERHFLCLCYIALLQVLTGSQ